MNQPHPILILSVAIVVLVVLGFLALWGFRGYQRLASRAMMRIYRDIEVRPPRVGDVMLRYHTYHGLIAWLTPTEHRAALAPDEARLVLGRLLRFNLVWGLVTYGALFIAPLAVLNYWLQRRSIAIQVAAGGLSMGEAPPPMVPLPSAATLANPYFSPLGNPDASQLEPDELGAAPRSPVIRVAGWILGLLCVLFVVCLPGLLIQGEWGPAVACGVMALLFGWRAVEWIPLRRRTRR